MKQNRRAAAIVTILALSVARAFTQAEPQKPSFDVISIKPSAPLGNGPISIGGGAQGDRFTMNNATLRMLLQRAYQQPGNAARRRAAADHRRPWLDRVGSLRRAGKGRLQRRLETRELPIYELVVGKDGSKLKPSADQTPVDAPLVRPQ